MQNKGAIRLLAILFALVSLYQLSFSFFTSRVESKAEAFANSPQVQAEAQMIAERTGRPESSFIDSLRKSAEAYFLDSMANEVIYSLGVVDFTFKESKEREINLGLDLKGGMNVTLEVAVSDVVVAMAGSNKSEVYFQKAINEAIVAQQNSQDDFISLFYQAWTKNNPGIALSSVFATVDLKDLVTPTSTDEEVLKVLHDQANAIIGNTYDILSKRIDQFGVAQPRIQKLQNGRILVELPGVKDPRRVRKILQSTARLEFWETYDFSDPKIFNALSEAENVSMNYFANKKVSKEVVADTAKAEVAATAEVAKDTASALIAATDSSSLNIEGGASADTMQKATGTAHLFQYLNPNYYQNKDGKWYPGNGAILGTALVRDTARVNAILNLPQVKALFPRDMRLMWGVKAPDYMTQNGNKIDALELYIVQVKSRDGEPPLDGSAISDARRDYSQNGTVEVTMNMNSEGAHIWKNLTHDNIKKSIAIVLDGYVYSAPVVQNEIGGGVSQITGNFSLEEAEDLANVLKSGKLPVPARIIEEAIVGPSLGQEAINSGLASFVASFFLVLIYMIFFYGKAGIIADIALLINVFLLFGVLASLQAVLTLPGIAGIVLTMGMAVDANVIIYERIKEEIRAGKGILLAINDGFKNAYSAIIDGNVTTMLTGIVLFIFGSGPVQGFATTLMVGIITTLFTGLLITRLIFDWALTREMNITFATNMAVKLNYKGNFDFIGFRKKAYIISAVVLAIGFGSMIFRGFNYGVDFSGGRTYVIRFDQDVNTAKLAQDMKAFLVDEDGNQLTPEVKTFGPSNQVKITTKYLIESTDINADSTVDRAIYEGVKNAYKNPISFDTYALNDDSKAIGMMSSQKVDPTISDDLIWQSYLAVIFAIAIIFLYILIRFRKWQFSLGGTVALVHDALIIMSLYSVFSGILPFDLEVDQAFIAAILTIMGYSINDTVIIFDRIRENLNLFPKHNLQQNMNSALNSTMMRSINTTGTTVIVLLAIFLFGGEVIRGFAFSLMIGIIVGTYSSIFVASPITFETLKNKAEGEVVKK